MYKLARGGGGVIHSGGFSIPENPLNRFWQEYLAWLADGNTPDPADPEPPPDSTAVAKAGAKAWYLDNPNAALLFELPIEDLETRIDAIDLTTAAGRNEAKFILKVLSIAVRVLVKREGFVD